MGRGTESGVRWPAKAVLFAICAIQSHAVLAQASENSSVQSHSVYTEDLDEEEEGSSNSSSLWANYYTIFYGPSVKDPSSYQAAPNGGVDKSRPVLFKNYLTLGYNLTDNLAVAGVGYFTWQPVLNRGVTLQDPQARLAVNSIAGNENWNWYGDVRSHFAVSSPSRRADLLAGFQTFHYLSFTPSSGPLSFGTYLSGRYNVFGKLGVGNDVELYVAPSMNVQLGQTVSLSLLYEAQASHTYGGEVWTLDNDGTSLEPGLVWEITPKLIFNPYLNLFPGNKVTLSNTSVGATLSWVLL